MKKKCCHVRMLFPNKYCSKDNLDRVIDMQQYNPLIHQQLRESKIQAVIHIVMSKTLINGADGEANWSGVVNFHYMQMSLALSVWFIFSGDRSVMPCASRFFVLWQRYNLRHDQSLTSFKLKVKKYLNNFI